MRLTGLQVHAFGDAEGRPVVALHGVNGHGRRWRRLGERYLTGIRVYAPDLRGHGWSDWSPPWTLEQHATDVLTTMDRLGLDQVDLLAHSFGGAIAVYLARLAPTRVGKLALLDPAIGLPAAAAGEAAHGYLGDESYADLAEARADLRQRWPEAGDEALDDEVADFFEHCDDGRWRRRREPAAVVTAYSEMARPAVVPPAGTRTLLVAAARADFVRPEYVSACRAELGDDLTVVRMDCGHGIYVDRPDETAALVQAFLDGEPMTDLDLDAEPAGRHSRR
ncbi:MAG TPA: alpha/beta hydrolase [Micromonosporaceae bacterium]